MYFSHHNAESIKKLTYSHTYFHVTYFLVIKKIHSFCFSTEKKIDDTLGKKMFRMKLAASCAYNLAEEININDE